jgi:signal transduction histidine kinase
LASLRLGCGFDTSSPWGRSEPLQLPDQILRKRGGFRLYDSVQTRVFGPATVSGVVYEAGQPTMPEHRKSNPDMAEARRRQAEVNRLETLLSAERDALSKAQQGIVSRDEFLAIVSHELRNALNVIEIYTVTLQRATTGDEQSNRIAQALDRAVKQMNRIVSDLMDLAAIQTGRLSLRFERGNLRSLIDAAIEAFQAVCREKSITIERGLSKRPLPARFDPARLLQVLHNLLANAVKFTPEGGRISIEVQRVGDLVEVTVRDTGIGIPSEELPAIFDRFHQVEKRGRRCLGLGLYISRSIVEAHGGRIWGESRIGEGSSFSFTVPAP